MAKVYTKTANTVGLYHLEADGTDSSGNGHNLTTVSGTPTYVPAKFGNGAMLDNGESLSIADNLGITTGNITIIKWIKITTDITSAASGVVQLNVGDATDVGHGIQYEYNAGTRRLFFRRSRWGVSHQGPYYNITLGTTNLYCLGYTYDGTNVRGYVNGVLVGTGAASGNGSGTTSASFSIGATGGCGESHIVDETIVENKAWSDLEMAHYYTANNSALLFNLASNWKNN